LSIRVCHVWEFKGYGDGSYIGVAPARSSESRNDWAISADVVTTASNETKSFKEQTRSQLDGVAELPAGTVLLEISYTVVLRRYWPNLWKASVDSLDPILGRQARPGMAPRDDRITALGLDQAVDPAFGHSVRITVRASPWSSISAVGVRQ
jgi:hypothetical protein